jgi:putative addiction module component (TIGR02574 family)
MMLKVTLFDEALSLPPADKAELIDRLIASFEEGEYVELSPGCLAEVERRMDDLDKGRVLPISEDEFYQRIGLS